MFRNTTAIHTALAFDQNFIVPFYALLISLFDSNKQNCFVFHLIVTGLTAQEREEIANFIRKHGQEVFFYQVNQNMVQKFVLPESTHFSFATYYRLFFPAVVPTQVRKLLYLDTDIIVIGDLAPLYNLNIDKVPLAASVDPKINRRPELGVYEDNSYFNAGVLLINLEQWTKQEISSKAIDFIFSYPDKIQWADQDGLNAVLVNNWEKFDNKFNITYYDIPSYLTKKELLIFLRDKVIIHFTTQHKPWLISGANRLRFLYQRQLKYLPTNLSKKHTDLDNKFNYLKFLKIVIKEFLVDYTPVFYYRKRRRGKGTTN